MSRIHQGLIIRAALLSVVMICQISISGCSKAPSLNLSNSASHDEESPYAFKTIGEVAEDAYDSAKEKNWQMLSRQYETLQQTIQQLPGSTINHQQDILPLHQHINALKKAIQSRNNLNAMRETNQLTLDAIKLSARYKPSVPQGVSLLDYDGRELEIWSKFQDQNQLKETVVQIQQTWHNLRPIIESRNAKTEANRFDELIKKLEIAQTIGEYQQLAASVLAEVDNLEKVFAK